jgi:hypothetical protein
MAEYPNELAPEERDRIIEKIAAGVVKRGLETPAILFLEMHKPVTFFASQGLIAATPFIAPFVGFSNLHTASKLLEKRDNVERLIQRIEELAEEHRAAREREQRSKKETEHAAR